MNKLNLIIFGCSQRAIEIEHIIRQISEINIVCYTDNNPDKWNSTYLGHAVISVDEFLAKCKKETDIIVLAATWEFDGLLKQIEGMNLKNKCFFSIYSILHENGLFSKYGSLILKNESIGKNENEILLIVNEGLPKQGNLYRSGFVFRRLKAYRESGIGIDALGFTEGQLIETYSHENEDIIEGRENALSYLLTCKQYKKMLIHFLFPEMMRIINTYAPNTEIVCWVHGYEIISPYRRLFNYTQEEIEARKEKFQNESQKKKTFWKEMFCKQNASFVFVSEWLKDTVAKDIGISPLEYSIIPNYIDGHLYSYKEKQDEDVCKILVIKASKARVYANDLVVKVVQILSQREIFEKLTFEVYGDGPLFDNNYQELIESHHPNVKINKRFLTQNKIAALHKTQGIFLCPTRQDSQGVSMCEAMSSGLVVVTNNVAAVPEYINNTCGILCDSENAKQMADAIEWLVNNPRKFGELSKNAATYMKQRCGFNETIGKELELIRNRLR